MNFDPDDLRLFFRLLERIALSSEKLVKMLDEGECGISCSIEGKCSGSPFEGADLYVEVIS